MCGASGIQVFSSPKKMDFDSRLQIFLRQIQVKLLGASLVDLLVRVTIEIICNWKNCTLYIIKHCPGDFC